MSAKSHDARWHGRMSSFFWMILPVQPANRTFEWRSWQQAEFFAAQHCLSPARSSELVEGTGAVGLYRVLGHEELSCDLAIAEAASNEGQDFKFADGYPKPLLLGCIWSERRGWLGDEVCRAADSSQYSLLPSARDAQTEPDAKGGKEDGDEGAVQLDRVLDDDEAVFGVLQNGD